MGYSCKQHLPWSQTGYRGGGWQFSRWILKAGNHFAKNFSSLCSLKRNKNKENEMQEWRGVVGGWDKGWCLRTFIFNAKCPFAFALRRKKVTHPPPLPKLRWHTFVWVKLKFILQGICCGQRERAEAWCQQLHCFFSPFSFSLLVKGKIKNHILEPSTFPTS